LSDTGRTLEEAAEALRGTVGWLLCVLQARRGLSREAVRKHVTKLRRAADKLEELV